MALPVIRARTRLSANGKTTGLWYFETTLTTLLAVGSGPDANIGIGTTASGYFNMRGTATVGCMLMALKNNGQVWINGVNSNWILGNRASGDVIGMAVDLDARLIWFRIAPSGPWNGTWNSTGTPPVQNPAIGSGGIALPAGTMIPFCAFSGSANVFTANFGATAFVGAIP